MVKNILYSLICFLLWMTTTSESIAMEGIPDDPEEPFIKVELEYKEVYVQSMVRYTVRLYRKSHLQRGYFMDQASPDAVMELSHESDPIEININGREYELLERHYLIFPQHSGTLELPAPVFSSQNLFVRGESLKLKVKPRADKGTGHWLPAKKLEIVESFPLPDGDIAPGMQLKHTVTIKAVGLTGPQLPILETPVVDGVEIQNLGSKIEQSIIDGVMVGKRTIQHLFIPNQGGTYTIPETSINWWNTKTQTSEIVTLQKKSFTVADTSTNSNESRVHADTNAENKVIESSAEIKIKNISSTNLYLLAFITSIIVYGLLIWHYRLIYIVKKHTIISSLVRKFKKGCLENDPHKAINALLSWGHMTLAEQAPVSILGFRKHFKELGAQTALIELDRAKYTTLPNDWDGNDAIKNIFPLIRFKWPDTTNRKTALPTLY